MLPVLFIFLISFYPTGFLSLYYGFQFGVFIGLPEYVNEPVSESVSVSYVHFFLFACFVLFYSDNIKS